ncbi:hypothetical protein B0H67DRAFT_577196 [Lasiosphaeris hirsuta]|uniref:Uncharacterized protein n=1 Tax=Lasiosphaeris hirsuta TaxID=260670 RepID=A0AA40ARN1_9PEZI|nr:hypothetical protein B0H67DRAFT_577196 [Lasiosphaeris hirsuta]
MACYPSFLRRVLVIAGIGCLLGQVSLAQRPAFVARRQVNKPYGPTVGLVPRDARFGIPHTITSQAYHIVSQTSNLDCNLIKWILLYGLGTGLV